MARLGSHGWEQIGKWRLWAPVTKCESWEKGPIYGWWAHNATSFALTLLVIWRECFEVIWKIMGAWGYLLGRWNTSCERKSARSWSAFQGKSWVVILPRYLCLTGKWENTWDPRRWKGELSMGKCCGPQGVRTWKGYHVQGVMAHWT